VFRSCLFHLVRPARRGVAVDIPVRLPPFRSCSKAVGFKPKITLPVKDRMSARIIRDSSSRYDRPQAIEPGSSAHRYNSNSRLSSSTISQYIGVVFGPWSLIQELVLPPPTRSRSLCSISNERNARPRRWRSNDLCLACIGGMYLCRMRLLGYNHVVQSG
jgi:hypothetical protein